MPVFTPASVRPRQELALAIVEGEGSSGTFIGPSILPDFPINRRSAHLIKALMQDTLGLRHIAADKYIHVPGTHYERAVAKFSDASLSVNLRGLELVIPNEVELDYAGYLSVESFFANRFGREVTGLTKEYLIAAAIFSTGNFGSATNSAVAYTSALLTTNSYIGDTIAATRRLKAKGEPGPYVQVMSGPVFERIRQAATVQGYVAGTLAAGQEATLGMLEAAVREFGISKILVGDAYYNNAADGATPSLSQVWSNTYIWTGRAGMSQATSQAAGVSVPTIGGVGVNAYWEGWVGGQPVGDVVSGISVRDFAGGNYVESYYQQEIDSVVCRVKVSSTPFLGNTRAGDLIATQYS
jgi:hypothetical protein